MFPLLPQPWPHKLHSKDCIHYFPPMPLVHKCCEKLFLLPPLPLLSLLFSPTPSLPPSLSPSLPYSLTPSLSPSLPLSPTPSLPPSLSPSLPLSLSPLLLYSLTPFLPSLPPQELCHLTDRHQDVYKQEITMLKNRGQPLYTSDPRPPTEVEKHEAVAVHRRGRFLLHPQLIHLCVCAHVCIYACPCLRVCK